MNISLFGGVSTAYDTTPMTAGGGPGSGILFQSLPVTPPVAHDGGGLLPVTFDGRRRRTKPLDAMGFDGMTLRDKKLLQFRDQLVKRRKQLNIR
jgi:hypothetical protein